MVRSVLDSSYTGQQRCGVVWAEEKRDACWDHPYPTGLLVEIISWAALPPARGHDHKRAVYGYDD